VKEDDSVNEPDLLQSCAERLGSRLDGREEGRLEEWWKAKREEAALLAGRFVARDSAEGRS
jgi:hypothetical protein